MDAAEHLGLKLTLIVVGGATVLLISIGLMYWVVRYVFKKWKNTKSSREKKVQRWRHFSAEGGANL